VAAGPRSASRRGRPARGLCFPFDRIVKPFIQARYIGKSFRVFGHIWRTPRPRGPPWPTDTAEQVVRACRGDLRLQQAGRRGLPLALLQRLRRPAAAIAVALCPSEVAVAGGSSRPGRLRSDHSPAACCESELRCGRTDPSLISPPPLFSPRGRPIRARIMQQAAAALQCVVKAETSYRISLSSFHSTV
jgi:hypothetical protein